MTVRIVPRRVITTQPGHLYQTDDGETFENLDEAVDHDNELRRNAPKPPVQYEQIWSIQEAINKAVAEDRVVRFIWEGDNASIKKGIVDKKGCSIMKPEKKSKDVAVIPPSVKDFDFALPDTSVTVSMK